MLLDISLEPMLSEIVLMCSEGKELESRQNVHVTDHCKGVTFPNSMSLNPSLFLIHIQRYYDGQ